MRLQHSRRAALAALATVSFATVGAGVVSATTPPSEPTDTSMTSDSSMTDSTMTGDTMTESTMTDSSTAGGSTAPATGPSGPLCAAASGESAGSGSMTTDTMATGDTMATDTMSTDTMATGDTMSSDTMATGDTGAPTDAGSMADSPVATAASMNPLLGTLTEAIDAAGLTDTLDSGEAFTVLAPVDSAFAKVPPAELEAAMADPSGLLATVLTYHVIPEQLSSADLAAGGTFQTVLGEEISFEARNDTVVVNGGAAAVQCADIPTANATVHLIDSVLLPPSVSREDTAAATETTTAGTTMDSSMTTEMTGSTDAAGTTATTTG